jgi:hypothetical protein
MLQNAGSTGVNAAGLNHSRDTQWAAQEKVQGGLGNGTQGRPSRAEGWQAEEEDNVPLKIDFFNQHTSFDRMTLPTNRCREDKRKP